MSVHMEIKLLQLPHSFGSLGYVIGNCWNAGRGLARLLASTCRRFAFALVRE